MLWCHLWAVGPELWGSEAGGARVHAAGLGPCGAAGEQGWEWVGDTDHGVVEKRTHEASGLPEPPSPPRPPLSAPSVWGGEAGGEKGSGRFSSGGCCCLFSGLPAPCYILEANCVPSIPAIPSIPQPGQEPQWSMTQQVLCQRAGRVGCRAQVPTGPIFAPARTRPGSELPVCAGPSRSGCEPR